MSEHTLSNSLAPSFATIARIPVSMAVVPNANIALIPSVCSRDAAIAVVITASISGDMESPSPTRSFATMSISSWG